MNPDFSDAWRHANTRTNITLGSELCGTPFPDYDKSERYYARVRSVDIAGNVSDWTETPNTVQSGCSVAPAPFAWGLPLGLLALGLRRRSARV